LSDVFVDKTIPSGELIQASARMVLSKAIEKPQDTNTKIMRGTILPAFEGNAETAMDVDQAGAKITPIIKKKKQATKPGKDGAS
jgi:hypothetical protein